MGQPGNQRRNKKYMETNANENTMVQKLWDTAKAVQRGKLYRTNSRRKKNLKQLKLTPKGASKRKTNKT